MMYAVGKGVNKWVLVRVQFCTCTICTILPIADEGPRTETSDSIKLLIHVTTS